MTDAKRREYRRRDERARKRMTPIQRAAFDAFLDEDFAYHRAARRLGWDEEEMFRIVLEVQRILMDEINAPQRPWWRWW